jgi:hypothetical protein
MGVSPHPYAMPYENDVPFYVCRDAKQPIGVVWGTLKVFVQVHVDWVGRVRGLILAARPEMAYDDGLCRVHI